MADNNVLQFSGPEVSDGSKFRIILVIARRARQLQSGARPLSHTSETKSIGIAKEEFSAGLLPFEILPGPLKPA